MSADLDPGPSSPFADACHAIIDRAVEAVDWAAARTDAADLLERFALVDDAYASLRAARDVVVAEVLATNDDGDEIPSGGTLRLAGGAERKNFDVELLRSKVAAACAERVGMDGDRRVDDIVEASWSVVPSSPSVQFKSRAAKVLGIKLDDYAEVVRSPRTARIEGRR